MRKGAVVAGTGFAGRNRIIRKHVYKGMLVILKRDPSNKYDENAVGVFINVKRFFGLFGESMLQIGFIKASSAKSLAKAMDSGKHIKGFVSSFYAPPSTNFPRVSIEITDED